jgi:hypothetical protein
MTCSLYRDNDKFHPSIRSLNRPGERHPSQLYRVGQQETVNKMT